MKTLSKLSFYLLLFAISFTISCNKDDDDNGGGDSQKTTAEYLTSGSWKLSAMTIDPGVSFGGAVLTDFYAQMQPCAKDDFSTFSSSGGVTDDEGPTKCSASDPQTTTGTWTLSADNTTLTLEYPNEDPTVIIIQEINDSVLKGTYTLIEDFGAGLTTYTFSMTMSKM